MFFNFERCTILKNTRTVTLLFCVSWARAGIRFIIYVVPTTRVYENCIYIIYHEVFKFSFIQYNYFLPG
jgi:hypothetical protein